MLQAYTEIWAALAMSPTTSMLQEGGLPCWKQARTLTGAVEDNLA
jgi:hypothetical protein